MKGIRLLLINGKKLIRHGEQGILELEEAMVREMLEIEEDSEIVGDFPSAEEALRQPEILSPNIILMEAKMPGIGGIEATRRLHQIWPQCKVIMLTWHEDYRTEAGEAGVSGYLFKGMETQDLVQAIKRVYQGELVFDERLTLTQQVVEWEAEYLPPEGDSPVTLVKEVELAIPPPIDAAQLLRLIFQVEEWLDADIVQQIGSCHRGLCLTILLNRAAPPFAILDRLGKMPEVDSVREETGAKYKYSIFPKNTMANLKTLPQQELLLTLKQATTAEQLALAENGDKSRSSN